MIEKILKDTYVNPKVELTQTDYNRLVQTAQMKAKKIEERAREIYEKEGVTKIQFTGRFYRKRYGEVECDKHEFTVDCNDYDITPTGDYEKTLYKIPQESRQKNTAYQSYRTKHKMIFIPFTGCNFGDFRNQRNINILHA